MLNYKVIENSQQELTCYKSELITYLTKRCQHLVEQGADGMI